MESVTLSKTGAVPAKTLEEVFAARHGCTPEQFQRRMFWRTLHWHALFLAPLFLIGRYFSVDFALIASCGHARSMEFIREETEAYRTDPRNAAWLRRRAKIRISTRKLLRMARANLES
jgi:hypothetical protein